MFGSSSPFGASSTSLFGAASASSSPFAASSSTSPFGMNSSNPFAAKPFGSTTAFGGQTGGSLFGSATGVFGATQASTPAFGASPTPAFGATATPAFGASQPQAAFGTTQPAFGASGSLFGQKPASTFGSFGSTQPQSNPFGTTSTFGQAQSGFGGQQMSAFGAASSAPAFGGVASFGSSSPSFGAQTTPAFGSGSPAFGTTGSGFGFGQTTPAFGATPTTPAFGAASTPAPAFGTSTTFGAQPASPFGGPSMPTFGGTTTGAKGSRVVPYASKIDMENNTQTRLICISAMDAYKDKSPEELRWEDYQSGDKGGPAPNTASTGLFGTSPSAFTTGFNQSSGAASANPFSASPFAPKPASPFQASSSPSFPTSTSVFGSGFNMGSTPAPAPSFTPNTSSTFMTGSSPIFNPTPTLNQNPPVTPFQSPSIFGSTPAQNPGFAFNTSSSSSLFPTPAPAFNTQSSIFSTNATPSMFNSQVRPAQSTPAFGNTISTGNTANTGFGFSYPQNTGMFGGLGSQPQSAANLPNVLAPVSNPFGNLPAMPQMSIGRTSGPNPSVQYGISSTPVSEKPVQPRASSLLTPRHITPRSKVKMHPRRSTAKKDGPKVSFFSEGEDSPLTPKADVSFVPRENPRALFIHQSDHVTPVSGKRSSNVVQHEDVYSDGREGIDEEFIQKDSSSPSMWSDFQNTPKQPEKVNAKAPAAKQNGVSNEQHNHRGNGNMHMAGHRAGEVAVAYEHGADIEALMPKLRQSDYYTEPRIQELAAKERAEPGYCRRVPDFVLGRKGYGHVKFLGETDVRRLDIEGIIQFDRCEVLVYMDESKKPPCGHGLNKPAEVTLLNVKCIDKKSGKSFSEGPEVERFEKKLKKKTEEQGAEFVSYDASKGEWTFRVKHFSRYGFDDSDSDEEVRQATDMKLVVSSMDMEGVEGGVLEYIGDELLPEDLGQDEFPEEEEAVELEDEVHSRTLGTALPHSLPAQLRLNPSKLQQLKTCFFPLGEEDVEDEFLQRPPSRTGQYHPVSSSTSNGNHHHHQVIEDSRPAWPQRSSPWKACPPKQMRVSPHASWQRAPVQSVPDVSLKSQPGNQLMRLSSSKLDSRSTSSSSSSSSSASGFRLEDRSSQIISGSASGNIVDAALFLGSSFRVGWGPQGVFVHSGTVSSVGKREKVLSSCINFEKVSLDRTARDENGKLKDNLLELQFVSPLLHHMSYSKMLLPDNDSCLSRRVVTCNRAQLQEISDGYEDLIEKQCGVAGISEGDQLVLKHQVMVWQLASVLFSEKIVQGGGVESDDDDDDVAAAAAPASESMVEVKARIANIDESSEVLCRRADFSSWLQGSVLHLVEGELQLLAEEKYLEEILCLLTGRQVALAVEKAVIQGDVRLGCLLSQAVGLTSNRHDMASQIEVWDSEGLDTSLIEEERMLIFKLLSGDIRGSLEKRNIDWKRFLGMLMWYGLEPDAGLPILINEFHQLVEEGEAPLPSPMFIEEEYSSSSSSIFSSGSSSSCDTAYYLMLLHARGSAEEVEIGKMFCAASSTFDSLDHRMAWHLSSVLESVGVLEPLDLHVLDMSFVAQLLSAGLVHWSVYIVLHMRHNLELQEKIIKEILGQYCEIWCMSETQRTFLEKDLHIPSHWLHQALAVYWRYRKDDMKTLESLLMCFNWQEAHVLFMKISAPLFLKGEHNAMWNLASEMESHKMEIVNWDLGGGLYIDFFMLKGLFNSESDSEMVMMMGASSLSVEDKISACKEFFERLKDAQTFWELKAPVQLRLALSRMGDEVARMVVGMGEGVEMYNVAMDAPVPEDVQLCRLHSAVATFASWVTAAV